MCVLLDLKRAFDTIDRKELLHKLQSESIYKNIGVPQGSILERCCLSNTSTICLRILKNEFFNLFADDTLVYVCETNPEEMVAKLNDDLNYVDGYVLIN